MSDGDDGGHDYRSELLRELGVGRENLQGKFKLMRRVQGTDNDYLLLPYLRRFNSAKRVVPVRDGFETALLTVDDAHQDVVVVILTTDSKRFDWLDAAVSSLYESKSRLMSLLSTDYRLNYRPDNLSMLEFTESRLLHVHVVLFVMSWAVLQLSPTAKWDELGYESAADIRSARRQGDDWLLHHDDRGTATLCDHLGKAVSGLQMLAGLPARDVWDAADGGDVLLWRQGCTEGRGLCGRVVVSRCSRDPINMINGRLNEWAASRGTYPCRAVVRNQFTAVQHDDAVCRPFDEREVV